MPWAAANDGDIARQGFTLLPRPVDAALIDRAAALIAADFARNPPRTAEDWLWASENTFCLPLVETGRLDFLAADSGLLAFAEGALGPCKRHLRFQVARRRAGDVGWPHIDGCYPADDKLIDTPDAVVGIYLTDVTRREDGAVETWPGSRRAIAEWAAGFTALPSRRGILPFPRDLPDGQPILGAKGTAFLIHGTLPHRNALRTIEEGYRDAVFFRMYRTGAARDVLGLLQSGGTGWRRRASS